MANLLGGQNLFVEYPEKLLLNEVTVGVSAGDRIGIVGRNGDGKSTLLKILFSQMKPHRGVVTARRGLRLGLLSQQDTLRGSESVETVLLGGKQHHEILRESRIREILDGLTPGIDPQALVDELSGGQRRRLALAKLLIGQWDVIGLDEPTNHLDMEGVAWLAEHLNHRWAPKTGALLLVTHDRWLLDAVSKDTWEVHDGIVEPFEGGYAAYVLARVERDRQAAVAAQKRQNLLRKELAWLRRGAPARTSKPKFRLDAAYSLIEDVPPPRDSVELVKLATARLGKIVVDLVDVDFSYPSAPAVLKDVTWRLAPGQRVGILGANGAGKSTLLGLLAGELTPSSGRRREGKTVRLALLDQEFRALQAISDYPVYEVLSRLKGSFEVEGVELSPAQMLQRLGFNPSQLQAQVGALSGGQKRRLQILLVLLEEPNVLILDEPTNDIDTDTLTALEDVLDAWPGTLLVVSHDRYLIERITDEQYAVIDHHLRHLPGGVDEYLRLQQHSGRQEETSQTPAQTAKDTSGRKRYEDDKALTALERKISKAREQESQAEAALFAIDPADFEALADADSALKDLRARREGYEEQWLNLAEQLGK